MSNLLRGVAVAAMALVLLWATQARAQAPVPFDLVTAAEAKQAALAEAQAQARPPVRTRQVVVPRGNAPAIRVLTPSAADTAVPAPVRIQAAFKPAPGTRIVPSSFRVLYGLLKIDLTERLRPHSTVNEEGFLVEGAKVPDGQHRLILQVADDQGNTTEQELRIRVAAVP